MKLLTHNNNKTYKVCKGTYYSPRTPHEVIVALESARYYQHRIRVHYGDTTTGQDWLEEHDVTGRVGRSAGEVKIPLMLPNRESTGGCAILTDCIVKIRTTTGAVLYQHPTYHHGAASLHSVNLRVDGRSYRGEIRVNGKTHARFDSLTSARRWVHKMGLENCCLTI